MEITETFPGADSTLVFLACDDKAGVLKISPGSQGKNTRSREAEPSPSGPLAVLLPDLRHRRSLITPAVYWTENQIARSPGANTMKTGAAEARGLVSGKEYS